MKALAMVVALGMMAGCGTINTVLRNDGVTQENLQEIRSFCGAVPRVYSGVIYDFCTLHAEPARPGREQPAGVAMFVIVDMGVSAVLDTLALPYTLYRQHVDGSIEVSPGISAPTL